MGKPVDGINVGRYDGPCVLVGATVGVSVDGAKVGTAVRVVGDTVGIAVVGSRVGIIVGEPATTLGDGLGTAVTNSTLSVPP